MQNVAILYCHKALILMYGYLLYSYIQNCWNPGNYKQFTLEFLLKFLFKKDWS